MFVDTAGSLYAGAVVLEVFFPELDLFFTCVVLAIVAGLHNAAGGLAAVVYTDVIQAVVLLLGSCLLTYNVFVTMPSISRGRRSSRVWMQGYSRWGSSIIPLATPIYLGSVPLWVCPSSDSISG